LVWLSVLVIYSEQHNFETRLDLAGRPGIRGWNQVGLKKKQEKKKSSVTRQVDPVTWLTWQDPKVVFTITTYNNTKINS
jgi:hypothetical protein